MSDEQLNTAIDEVARRLTEGAPAGGDAGFRGRVLARIESGDAPRRRWRPLFVFAPLATVAAIVLALMVARQAIRLPPSPQGFGATRPRSPQGLGGTSPPSPNGLGETRTPNTIDVAPLGVDPLAPDPIPIERLETIVPLVIAPLDSTEEQRRYE